MKTSKLPPGQFLRPLIYGLLTCIFALLIREALLTEEIRYTSNWTTYVVIFILGSGAFVYFRQHSASLTTTRQIFPSALIFGIGAGIAIGLAHYLTITVLDPDYLQKALDASYKSWAARGYSQEAIAGQRELTAAFQDPLKNSLSAALFYFLLTAGLSFIIGWMTRKGNTSIVHPDDLQHA